MTNVHMADRFAGLARLGDRLRDRPVGRAPAHNHQVAAGLADGHILRRDVVGDAENLVGAGVGHLLVVGRLVADVAGIIALLDPADPVRQPRCARLDPDARQGLRVAGIGVEPFALGRRLAMELHRERRIVRK